MGDVRAVASKPSEGLRAVVEVKWLLAAFPEAEMRNDVIYFNGSAFPVTTLQSSYLYVDTWHTAGDWADDIE